MVYLALQMLFWIVLSVIFGIFIGWLIWKNSSRADAGELSNLRQALSIRDKKIARLRDNIAQSKAVLKVCKEEIDARLKETT